MNFCFLCSLVALCATGALYAGSNVEAPVPVRMVAPEYPSELRRDGLGGVVTIACTIDEQGNVKDITIQKTTNEGFNRSALNALKKWKFKPARLDGVAVAQKVTIPLKFSVDA